MRGSVFVGTSLDGFIARPNGALDFLPDDPEPHGFDEFLASVDALVWGRKTYDTVQEVGTWFYGEKPVFVLSSRDLKEPPAGAVVNRMSGSPAAIVSALEERGIDHIYVDGGFTIQEFLRAGFIQRLIITRVPVLIGSGIPLFGPLDHDVSLTHVATRHYRSGLVQSEYQVAKPDPPKNPPDQRMKLTARSGPPERESSLFSCGRRGHGGHFRNSARHDPLAIVIRPYASE